MIQPSEQKQCVLARLAFFVKPVADDQFLAEVKSAFVKQSSKQSNGVAAAVTTAVPRFFLPAS
jgi:hypothetical protein